MIKYILCIVWVSIMLTACTPKQPLNVMQDNVLKRDFEHQWFGVGVKKDGTLQWRMEIDLIAGKEKVMYLDMDCKARLILQKMEGNTAIFFQAFEFGSQQCKEMVILKLELVDDHSMHYQSYDFLGREIAIGALVL